MKYFQYSLKENYTSSRVLIVGMNYFKNVSPLAYAVNDATAIKTYSLINSIFIRIKHVFLLTRRLLRIMYQNLLRDSQEIVLN